MADIAQVVVQIWQGVPAYDVTRGDAEVLVFDWDVLHDQDPYVLLENCRLARGIAMPNVRTQVLVDYQQRLADIRRDRARHKKEEADRTTLSRLRIITWLQTHPQPDIHYTPLTEDPK